MTQVEHGLATQHGLTTQQRESWERDGFLVVRGMVSPQDAAELREHFMKIHAQGVPGSYQPPTWEKCNNDVLKRYPRIGMPHRFDELSMRFMLNERVQTVLRDLFGDEPLAAQSMFYFKPPGARGQALHQDNFYLQVNPGTCIAAWMAVDDADEENGGMFVVPGSHRFEVLCPGVADMSQSFTAEYVRSPDGRAPVPVDLKAGDVLFFNGSTIHGSFPNTSKERFRCAFICHYVPDKMQEMAHHYYPMHTFAGEKLERAHAQGGGICGTEEWAALNTARAANPEWSPLQ